MRNGRHDFLFFGRAYTGHGAVGTSSRHEVTWNGKVWDGIGIGAAYGTAGVGTALLKMQVFGGLRGARGLASRHQGYYLARYLILTWSCGGLIHHLP